MPDLYTLTVYSPSGDVVYQEGLYITDTIAISAYGISKVIYTSNTGKKYTATQGYLYIEYPDGKLETIDMDYSFMLQGK